MKTNFNISQASQQAQQQGFQSLRVFRHPCQPWRSVIFRKRANQ